MLTIADRNDRVAALKQSLEHMPIGVRACGLILGSFCTASSLFGNLLIAVIFLLDKGLRQRQNVFVISAAIMEVITVFLRDFFLLGVYYTGTWQYGTVFMYVNGFVFYARNGFAIGHVIVVTVYRYALIVRPKAYRILSRTPVIVLMLVLLFLVPLVAAVIILSGNLVFNTKVMFGLTEGTLGIRNGTLTDEISGNWILPIFIYVLVNGLVLVGCNVHIYLFIRHSSRKVGGATASNFKGKETKMAKRRNKETHFVKIMSIMFSMFLFCYFPIPIAITTDPKWQLSHWVYLPLLLINWFSSSVSWLIYSITHSGFRVAVLKRIKCSPVIEFEDSSTDNPDDYPKQMY